MRQALSGFWLRSAVSTLALGLLAAGATAGAARAADADQPVASGTTLQELVVTAERRSTNLQTVPIAASVLTAEDLRQNGVTTLEQLQFITPSMSVSTSLQGNQFDIRGIGRGELSVQVPSGVQVYRDGVPVFPGFFQEDPYYDISSVQVLRGPQGTFAGLNATAGAIFITEVNPSTDGVKGYIEGEYGNYSEWGIQGALNVPLSSTFAIRLAFDHDQRDTFFHVIPSPGFSGNPGNLNSNSLRLSALWTPSPNFEALFKVDASYVDTGGYPATPNPGTSFAPDACPQEVADIFTFCTNAHLQGGDEWVRTVLDLKYTFASGIIIHSLSGFQDGQTSTSIDLDGTGLGTDTYGGRATERIWSQELNLLSPDTGRFRWILGAFYQLDTVAIPPGGFVEPGLNFFNYLTPKNNAAVFGQVTYEITPALELQVGLRYMDYWMSLHDTLILTGLPPFFLPPSGVGNLQESDSKLTGKAALNWKLDPNNFLYAFVATGHKSGSINSVNLAPFFSGIANSGELTIPPEDIVDYEGGWKATWLDGHVRTQMGFFYNFYYHFQLNTAVPQAPFLNEFASAGGTTTDWGFEGQLQAVIGPWSFDGVVGNTNTKLGSFSSIDPYNATPGARLLTGNQLPFAPVWTFSVGAQYTFELGNGNRLIPRLDYSYTDSQWADAYEETPGDRYGDTFSSLLAARNLVNGQLTFAHDDLYITLYGTNLTNQHYVDGLTNNLRYPGAPLQFGIRVRKSF
jgi:iron complex outermembrane receptor protein